jgi:type I restriction enzyme R subunit
MPVIVAWAVAVPKAAFQQIGIFSLIHKFNQDVNPDQPYSTRDDIIVISDEAHRTQAGRLARNMRLALPNAAFIGFTGTPLFKNDHLTRRIFGGYVSRYDFKRSEQDGATVKLVYENRGEKLGIARLDLNDRIADAIAQADLDPDKEALLEKLLGKDSEREKSGWVSWPTASLMASGGRRRLSR